MASTPKKVKVGVELLSPRQVEKLVEEAEHRGRVQGRLEILEWLEKKYLAPDAPARKSAAGEAILALASEAAKFIKGKK